MSEEMLDVLSVLDAQDEPVLGNCSLQIGEATVEFKNGRAKVPRRFASEVARYPKVSIPGYDGPVAKAAPNVAAELPNPESPKLDQVRDHKAEAVAAAEEHLREEEAEAPTREETSVASTGGLRAQTADGEPRCQARKGDGSQCSNPAADETPACSIAAHKSQVHGQ